MSRIVIQPELSSIIASNTDPRIVVSVGDGGASRFVELVDAPTDYPPSENWVLVGNDNGIGFQYRLLAPDSFFSLQFTSFTAKAHAGPFINLSVFERGYIVPSVDYAWTMNATPPTGSITITPVGETFSFSGASGSGTDLSASIADPGVVSGVVGDAQGVLELTGTVDGVPSVANLIWQSKAFWGWNDSDTLTGAEVAALDGSALYADKPVQVQLSGNTDTSYGYYAQPTLWTDPVSFLNALNGIALDMTYQGTVSITNGYGATQNYKVWRTTNITNVASLLMEIL